MDRFGIDAHPECCCIINQIVYAEVTIAADGGGSWMGEFQQTVLCEACPELDQWGNPVQEWNANSESDGAGGTYYSFRLHFRKKCKMCTCTAGSPGACLTHEMESGYWEGGGPGLPRNAPEWAEELLCETVSVSNPCSTGSMAGTWELRVWQDMVRIFKGMNKGKKTDRNGMPMCAEVEYCCDEETFTNPFGQ